MDRKPRFQITEMNILLIWVSDNNVIKYYVFRHGSEMHEMCSLASNKFVETDVSARDLWSKLVFEKEVHLPLRGYNILEVYKSGVSEL